MGLYSMPHVADAFLLLIFFAHVLMPLLLLKDWIVFHVGHARDPSSQDSAEDPRPHRILGVHVSRFRCLSCGGGDGECCSCGFCSVCLHEFEDGDEVSQVLGCRHFFHRACLDRWLLDHNHSTCPLCRTTTASA